MLRPLIRQTAPTLLEVYGVGYDTPAKLLVAAGDNPERIRTEAARLGDLGDAGEVIVSDSVRQLAEGKGFAFESRGEVTLKGFDQPERIWRVTHP